MLRSPWLFLLPLASLLLWCLPLAAAQLPPNFAQDPEQVEIKIVTFGPGATVHQYFGHNAMWVHDAATGVSALFNYGMFSFGPDMLPSYLKGRLTFWVEPTPVGPTLAHYKQMDRSISVQELNLGPKEKQRIVERLLHDIKPEHRFYQYDHFNDNCGTRLLGLIDGALGGQLRAALSRPARMSKRDHVRRYTEQNLAVYLALLFWMNDDMEAPIQVWHEMFLPAALEQALAELEYVNAAGERVPLVSRTYDLYESSLPPVPTQPTPMLGLMLGFGGAIFALSVLLSWLDRHFRAFWSRALLGLHHMAIGLVFGVPGMLAALMWLFTEHTVTYHNENLLLANPLTLLLLPLGVMMLWGSARAFRWARWSAVGLALLSLLGLLLKLLPAFDQANALPMAVLLPTNLGLALGHLLWQARPRAVAQGIPSSIAP